MNHFKSILFIIFRAYVAVLFLLLTFTHAWSGDVNDLSSSAQTDVVVVTGQAAGDVEDDEWDDEWEAGEEIADPL